MQLSRCFVGICCVVFTSILISIRIIL